MTPNMAVAKRNSNCIQNVIISILSLPTINIQLDGGSAASMIGSDLTGIHACI